MNNNRRNFLKIAGMAGIGVVGSGILDGFTDEKEYNLTINNLAMDKGNSDENKQSIIGLYGAWATAC